MSKVILCADDSVTMQTVAEITFRTTEYGYLGARSADEAIEKVKAQRPVLVLADAVMPGKTGYELCQALKADPATADIPVVILCGNSAPFDGAKGAQVGADGSLTKPWDTQVMLDKVTEILDKVAATGVAKIAGGAKAAAPAIAAPAAMAAPAPAAPPVAQIPPPAASMTPLAVPPVGPAVNPAAQIAAAAAQPKVAPPRSATIMGMPTIKMPGPGGTGPVAVVPPVAAPPAPVAQAPVASGARRSGPGRPGCGCPSAGRPSCAGRPGRADHAWRGAGRAVLDQPRADGERHPDQALGAGRSDPRQDGRAARRAVGPVAGLGRADRAGPAVGRGRRACGLGGRAGARRGDHPRADAESIGRVFRKNPPPSMRWGPLP
jgi:CheY-like chemotaxis protein